jgi:hypothetical protein
MRQQAMSMIEKCMIDKRKLDYERAKYGVKALEILSRIQLAYPHLSIGQFIETAVRGGLFSIGNVVFYKKLLRFESSLTKCSRELGDLLDEEHPLSMWKSCNCHVKPCLKKYMIDPRRAYDCCGGEMCHCTPECDVVKCTCGG